MVALSDQQLELYLFLKEAYPGEVHISDLTNDKPLGGLGIKGYTERFTEMRKKGFVIMNTKRNFYRIEGEPEVNLDDLREIYKQAAKRGYKKLMRRCRDRAESIKLFQEAKNALYK
jgi:hypothetical protein